MKRSTYWEIISLQEVKEKVVFSAPLSMEEAEDAYLNKEYEDILDSDTYGADEVISLKAL
jgi:hypothetical protein